MPTTTFKEHIRASLADPNLQAALDKNAEQRLRGRQAAFASIAEQLPELRPRAHQARAKVIVNLDHYLEQFIQQASTNGLIIHRAADAHQACEIVLQIAQSKGARLVAKSKTMVSEEIGLNAALQAAGIQAVETDLGEYIVQLRGEPPSHIVTPAVHLRREEVGQTFHEKLNIPLTDKIDVLTDAARASLRRTFLEADIGISGVNFGVAETGSLCIVTNEGNGRMVTTLPPVHIALMGIERLVANLDDLALMLTLLPKAATGQQITVYTQLIHGPRHPDELYGPSERHLVLVDHGRSKLCGSALNDVLLCIRCGACLNACPVFQEIGGHAYVGRQGQHTTYPGPIGSVLSPGLLSQIDFGHLAQASTLCGACREACPVDIDLPTLLLRVRAGGIVQQNDHRQEQQGAGVPTSVRWGLRVFTWIARNARRFQAAQKSAAYAARIFSPRRAWMHLPALTGWGYAKDFPRPAPKPFRQRWAERQISHLQSEYLPGANQPRRVQEETSAQQLPRFKVERFEQALKALEGHFIPCTAQQLPGEILRVLVRHGSDRLLAWEAQHLPNGLTAALQAAGVKISCQPDADIPVGLTGALAGVANTGTLVLPAQPGQPHFVSLTPEVHLAILHETDLYENLPQIFKLRKVQEASAVTLISGPSRTADIEMTLTIGVHGPGILYVFCLS